MQGRLGKKRGRGGLKLFYRSLDFVQKGFDCLGVRSAFGSIAGQRLACQP